MSVHFHIYRKNIVWDAPLGSINSCNGKGIGNVFSSNKEIAVFVDMGEGVWKLLIINV